MSDDETIVLRKTLIGGKTYADDYTVICLLRPAVARPAMALDLQFLRHAQRWRQRISINLKTARSSPGWQGPARAWAMPLIFFAGSGVIADHERSDRSDWSLQWSKWLLKARPKSGYSIEYISDSEIQPSK